MPAPIIGGLVNFVTQQLNITIWDGELPRQSPDGSPVSPDATDTSPVNWPAVKVTMSEGGFIRTWTTEDPYSDQGHVTFQIWGTSREQAEGVMNQIEALLAQASNWELIPLPGGPQQNPYYVVHLLLTRWSSVQEEGIRTALSQLLYRCTMDYDVILHGAIVTA